MRNAADRKQVRLSEEIDKRKYEQRVSDLRELLKMPAGRRWFSDLISELQPRTYTWDSNVAFMGLNAARRDLGSWLRDRIDEADPDALALMAYEDRQRQKAEDSERIALEQRSRGTSANQMDADMED